MSILDAAFHLRRSDFELDVAFTTPERGITALFGHSGSGKTTVLRCLAGLERAQGHCRLGDTLWQGGTRRLFVPPHRRELGYVFQEARLFPHLTVRANLEFGRSRLPRARRPDVEPVLEMLGIEQLLGRYPHEISGGEQQRVAIGRALLTAPRLLLMDEPLAALDRERKAEILPYLEQLHDRLQIPVVYVSHDLDEVVRLADAVIYLERGRVKTAGPTGEVLSDLRLDLSRSPDAAVQLETVVAGHDPGHDLTHLDFAGGRLHVRALPFPPGRRVRVKVAADDVMLLAEQPGPSSVPSVFPVTVSGLDDQGPLAVTARLEARGAVLLARLSRRAVTDLALHEGKRVFALVREAIPLC